MAFLRLASTTYVLRLLCCARLFVLTTGIPANHTNGGAVLDEATLSRAAGCVQSASTQICKGLTDIPQGGPWMIITEIYIYESSIKVLQNNAFQSFPNLFSLRASECHIETIEANAFSGLLFLGYVEIPGNKIRTLSSVNFPESVQYLDVSKNPLDFSGASPFPKSHSGLRTLYVSDVGLSEITSSHIQGLKALYYLRIMHNSLTSLNLQEFVGLEKLDSIDVEHNTVNTIVGLPSGVELQSVRFLDVGYNNIRSLDVDLFKGLPALRDLRLNNNPLTVSSSTPFLSHESLSLIVLSRINAAALSSKTLEKLPKLERLEIVGGGVSDITGVFTTLPALKTLNLMDNNVESVKKGTFAPTGNLERLTLIDNPLREFDPVSLDDVMTKGTIDISNSPMACEIDYDDLYDWIIRNNVGLYADCQDPPTAPPSGPDDCAADVDCGAGYCCKNKQCLEQGKCGVGTITSLPLFVLLVLSYFALSEKISL